MLDPSMKAWEAIGFDKLISHHLFHKRQHRNNHSKNEGSGECKASHSRKVGFHIGQGVIEWPKISGDDSSQDQEWSSCSRLKAFERIPATAPDALK
ncbi:hypothetical protein Gogos_021401 [Gossypium gossypioides]|uniref:Uncharacterized protein n=1 Tax=Gossypium gossypioides TaxID=34282 RepID=A0A7J9CY80_GOSGO|nr:hypothetical protein [Gossypium gossypioides]